jgi:hypothetical protein
MIFADDNIYGEKVVNTRFGAGLAFAGAKSENRRGYICLKYRARLYMELWEYAR